MVPAEKMAVGAERRADVGGTGGLLVAARTQAEQGILQNHMPVVDRIQGQVQRESMRVAGHTSRSLEVRCRVVDIADTTESQPAIRVSLCNDFEGVVYSHSHWSQEDGRRLLAVGCSLHCFGRLLALRPVWQLCARRVSSSDRMWPPAWAS